MSKWAGDGYGGFCRSHVYGDGYGFAFGGGSGYGFGRSNGSGYGFGLGYGYDYGNGRGRGTPAAHWAMRTSRGLQIGCTEVRSVESAEELLAKEGLSVWLPFIIAELEGV